MKRYENVLEVEISKRFLLSPSSSSKLKESQNVDAEDLTGKKLAGRELQETSTDGASGNGLRHPFQRRILTECQDEKLGLRFQVRIARHSDSECTAPFEPRRPGPGLPASRLCRVKCRSLRSHRAEHRHWWASCACHTAPAAKPQRDAFGRPPPPPAAPVRPGPTGDDSQPNGQALAIADLAAEVVAITV